jgi:hypothetical protein
MGWDYPAGAYASRDYLGAFRFLGVYVKSMAHCYPIGIFVEFLF